MANGSSTGKPFPASRVGLWTARRALPGRSSYREIMARSSSAISLLLRPAKPIGTSTSLLTRHDFVLDATYPGKKRAAWRRVGLPAPPGDAPYEIADWGSPRRRAAARARGLVQGRCIWIRRTERILSFHQ